MTDVDRTDRVAELRALIDDIPGFTLDEERFLELVKLRVHLWDQEDTLAHQFDAGVVPPEKFFELANALNEISMMQARDILGADFNTIFGDAGYSPQLLVDRDKFFTYQHSRDLPTPMGI